MLCLRRPCSGACAPATPDPPALVVAKAGRAGALVWQARRASAPAVPAAAPDPGG